ncbi:MAG: ferrochelatase [Candidatus Nanopelagicales bacterium]
MSRPWIGGLAGLGVAAGWASVHLMVRPGTGRLTATAPIAVGAGIASLAAAGGPIAPIAALGSVGLGALGGWTAATYRAMREPDRTPVPVAVLADAAPRRTAVVYFTHGEPSTYEAEPWVNMLFELERTVPSFPPRPVWPFILAGIKRSFDAVGRSPHCAIHAETMDAVARAVGRGDLRWYVSFLDADPPLRSAIAQAVREGATDLILLTVFLTDSDHTAEADAMDQAMGLTRAGVRTVRTPVLWDDPRLARMIADKVQRAAAGRDLRTVGVMLVGHGQPRQWDATHPTETQQEQQFRDDIRALLIADGFGRELVSDAWMSFRSPKVPDRVRELATRGATVVLGVPVTISADSLHSLHDTPELIRKGARGTALEVVDVSGWNTEPLLVDILADRVRTALLSPALTGEHGSAPESPAV